MFHSKREWLEDRAETWSADSRRGGVSPPPQKVLPGMAPHLCRASDEKLEVYLGSISIKTLVISERFSTSSPTKGPGKAGCPPPRNR